MQIVAEKGLGDLHDTKFEGAVDGECMTLYDIFFDDGNDENNGSNEVGDSTVLEDGIRTEACD